MPSEKQGHSTPATTMICFVGEQPLPNLLPIKFCCPSRVVLVFSNRTETVANNLSALLQSSVQIDLKEVEPYDVVETEKAIEGLLRIINSPPKLYQLTLRAVRNLCPSA